MQALGKREIQSAQLSDFFTGEIKLANLDWLRHGQDTTGADAGVFGYNSPSPIFWPFASTASGMVQLAMDGMSQGNPMRDRSETHMCDHCGDASGEGQHWLNVKAYNPRIKD